MPRTDFMIRTLYRRTWKKRKKEGKCSRKWREKREKEGKDTGELEEKPLYE